MKALWEIIKMVLWGGQPATKVKPDPPGWDTPLDQTVAPIHYEGDRGSL